MRSSNAGVTIVALVDEIETDARIAAKSLPSAECAAWIQTGTIPVMARACWTDAQAVAERLQALGQPVDIERVFRRAMGPRAFSILLDAVRGGRR